MLEPESVDDPSKRSRVEEAHRRSDYFHQHFVVDLHCGSYGAPRQ